MKISVALASYNGEKYIREQLQSILDQTVPVDEIIVSDDGSKDSTVEIVKSFNDPRIILLQDNVNHGYTGNFEHALKHTTGDIIFLSDQDDVWMPNKVERHLSVFESNPDVGLIITDGIIIDKNGNDINNIFFNPHLMLSASSIIPRKEYLSTAAIFCLANGMSMCTSRKFLNYSLPFYDRTIAHDVQFGFSALNRFEAYYLCEPLVKYRVHDTNTTIYSKEKSFIKRLKRSLLRAYNLPYEKFNQADFALANLDSSNPENNSAIHACESLRDISNQQVEYIESNAFVGICGIVGLRVTDKRYKTLGVKYFISQFLFLMLRKFLFKKSQLSNKRYDHSTNSQLLLIQQKTQE